MDLAFTDENRAFRARIRTWLEANLPKDWDARGGALPDAEDDTAAFLVDWERRLYEAGWSGIAVDRAYGGQGLSILEHFIVAEELGRRAAPEGINSIGRELVVPILLAVGTEAQKRRHIPPILACGEIWCQGFSESHAGSDLAAVRTRATRQGDFWVVNGRKLWTSFARHARWCLLLARTDTDAPKHKGLTLFAMPMDSPGILVQPLGQMTGRAEFNELLLEDVAIPAANVIGTVNEGWIVASRVLTVERATNRLYRQARFMNELRAVVQLMAETHTGQPTGRDGVLRHRLAEIYCELQILRCHNLKMVSRILAGEVIQHDASVVKLFWSELHQRLAQLAADVLGRRFAERGSWGTPTARFQDLYLQSRAETIYAGTSQIQRNIIADRVLRLPR